MQELIEMGLKATQQNLKMVTSLKKSTRIYRCKVGSSATEALESRNWKGRRRVNLRRNFWQLERNFKRGDCIIEWLLGFAHWTSCNEGAPDSGLPFDTLQGAREAEAK